MMQVGMFMCMRTCVQEGLLHQQIVNDVNHNSHVKSTHTTHSQQPNHQYSSNNKKGESNEQGGAGGSCINH